MDILSRNSPSGPILAAWIARRYRVPRQRGHLLSQCADLLEPGGRVAHDRGDAGQQPIGADERHDGEFDRNAGAVLAGGRYRQDLAVAVTGLPGTHGLAITVPM